MKTLLVYDSVYGNTAQLAEVMANIKACGPVTARHVRGVGGDDPTDVDLLVVGTPTQRFRPTRAVRRFLDTYPAEQLVRGDEAACGEQHDIAGDDLLTWDNFFFTVAAYGGL